MGVTMTSTVRSVETAQVEMTRGSDPADRCDSVQCVTLGQPLNEPISRSLNHPAVSTERPRHPWGHGYVPIQRRRWSRQKLDVMALPVDEPREVTAAEREDAPILRALAGYAL